MINVIYILFILEKIPDERVRTWKRICTVNNF